MDFWSRLVGGTHAPKKPAQTPPANDPQTRLDRFRRLYKNIDDLCNRPRHPASEAPLLEALRVSLERLATLIRDETRAPGPHACLQFAASHRIYLTVSRAATVSRHEPVVAAAVAVLAALVDSEEEDFLASGPFAKSVMRMVRQTVDTTDLVVGIATETSILELLFTISAKIRLQPELLPVWFQSTARPELEDVFVKEKKSFVGITQKDDFPLCYLFIDRVHHEGRIGDFARTGLLYIFEATGHSPDLEEWVVSSDLPTLMASGLGALYSQLSRELSIVHPDASLPAVLAMSDYSTIHPRATAVSAFSERHQNHMSTFLSYLAFWQDVLDHCRSSDVKQTLLDHFQILFLQQLLYPSLLQSSDTDAGSSVAVLTYMTAMLEALEYPDLVHMMLTYLLAVQNEPVAIPSAPTTPVRPSMPPRSPTTLKRRQSLMLLTAPKDPDNAVEPSLFNLVDLTLNSLSSRNSQTAFAALKLIAMIVARQKTYALGTLLKVYRAKPSTAVRTVGGLESDSKRYLELAASLDQLYPMDETYASLCDDVRHAVEAQMPAKPAVPADTEMEHDDFAGSYRIDDGDPLLRSARELLRTFFTNSVDVNLALSQALVSLFSCPELMLEGWLAVAPSRYDFSHARTDANKAWQTYLDDNELDAWSALQLASRRPSSSGDDTPALYAALQGLVRELNSVRTTVPNLDQLLAGRRKMLQAAGLDAPRDGSASLADHLTPPSLSDASSVAKGHDGNSSLSTQGRAWAPAPDRTASPHMGTTIRAEQPEHSPKKRSVFQPPPPEPPSTTDVLMRRIRFPAATAAEERTSSLNHVLTNVVILQDFVLELVAVLHVRADVLGEREVRCV